MDEIRFGQGLGVLLLLFCSFAGASTDYSAATHRIAAGDFNGDRRADLLVIARDPWRNSGILLSDSSGLPARLHQNWRSDHLGLDWSGASYQPIVGSFSRGRCTAGHMGSSCVYPDDLLLQASMPGTSALLFVDHNRVVFDHVAQSIPNTHIGLGWSAAEHRLISGHFDSDHYHDLFFQAVNSSGENALVMTTSLDGFPADTLPRQRWSGQRSGLSWSADMAAVVAGDFTGDGFDDLLSQSRTPDDQPYASASFGILAGSRDGFVGTDGGEPEAWLRWTRFDFLVPDWSATEYRLHVGNFNNDAYDDVLLQPRHPGGPAYIVLFGPRAGAASWPVLRLPSRPGGWQTGEVELLLADFSGDGRDQIYIQPVRPGVSAEIAGIDPQSVNGEVTLAAVAVDLPSFDATTNEQAYQPGSAVGSSPGGFSVDAAGAATYVLPLRIPPGVRGMQPDIALVYNHRAGDQWLGEGWSISGLPEIRRCGTLADPEADGFADGADLDTSDRYCLDGQRLVETDTVGEYRTEIDSRRRIRSHGQAGNGPAYFTVEDADGLVWEFGNGNSSRLHPRGQGVAASALVYAVARVSDRYGNAIDYHYFQDPESTAMRPDRIRWLNADGDLLGRLHFEFEQRKDIRRGRYQGYVVATPWRLGHIETETRSSSGQMSPVRSYQLRYQFSEISSRTYLTEVTECERTTGSCLGSTRFQFEPGRRGFATQPEFSSVRYQDREGLMLLDIDGNGVRDHVYLRRDTATQASWAVRKDGVDGAGLNSQPAIDWDYSVAAPVGYRAIPGDYDGDGFTDLAQPNDASNDAGTRIRLLRGGMAGLSSHSTSLPTLNRNFWRAGIAADMDGDGRSDLVTTRGATLQAFRSNGQDFDPQPWQGAVPGQMSARRLLGQTGDVLKPIVFDADGRTDLLTLSADCQLAPWVGLACWNHQWLVYSLADPLARGDDALAIVHALPPGDYIEHLKLLDINDDGLTDLLFRHADNARWELHIATGTGYEMQWSSASLQIPEIDDVSGGPDSFAATRAIAESSVLVTVALDSETLEHARVLDYNYDGYDDLLVAHPAEAELAVLLTSAETGEPCQALVRTGIPSPGPEHRTRLQVVDIGGDGQADLLLPSSSDRYQVFHARGASRGLLKSVTDGYGAVTSVSYGLLRDEDLHQHADAEFPYSRYAAPMRLVRETATPTGLGADERVLTRYEYIGARVHRQGRGFAGFGERRAWNVNRQLSTVNRYAQEFPLIGQVVQSEQRLGDALDAPDVLTISIPEFGLFEYPVACDTDAARDECLRLFRQREQGPLNLLRGQRFSLSTTRFAIRESLFAGGRKAWMPVVAEVEDLSFPVTSAGEVGADVKRRVVTTYHSETDPVDEFGNASRIVVAVDDGSGGPVHRVQVRAEWENRSDTWCIGLQRSAVATAESGDDSSAPRSRRYRYDERCSLIEEETLPELPNYRVTRQLDYDRFGNIVAERIDGPSFQARENRREYGSEYSGRFATAETNALGHRLVFRWDERFGAPLSEQQSGPGQASAARASVRLDGFGRLIAQTAPDSAARTEYSRHWCEDDCRSPMAVTRRASLRSDGQAETVERDSLGRIVHSTRLAFDGQAINTATHYDALGRESAVSLPYLDSDSARRCYTLRQHDALSRVLTELRPASDKDCRFASVPLPEEIEADSLQRVAYLYDLPHDDGWQRETQLQQPGRPDLRRLEVLDAMDRVRQIVESGGDVEARTSFIYTADGNLAEVSAADGSSTRFSYDPIGLASSMQDASMGARYFAHNALGELLFELDADGVLTRYRYDPLGRLERRIENWNYFSPSDPRQQVTDFAYDSGDGFGLGRLATATGPYPAGEGVPENAPRISYFYDDSGRVAHRRHSMEVDGRYRHFWTSQAYDDEGRLSEIAYPSSANDADEAYPGSDRLRVAYLHDTRGYLAAVDRIDSPERLWESLAVDADGRFVRTMQDEGALTTIRSLDRASGLLTGTSTHRDGETVQHLLYDWSADGLLLGREDLLFGHREEFEHDALGRLVGVRAYVDGGLSGERSLSYDAGGNPVAGALRDGQSPQRVLQFGDGSDRLNYEYDAMGRVVQRGGRAITRAASGLPASIATENGSIDFDYGPHRQRMRRVDEGDNGRSELAYIGRATTRLTGSPATFSHRVMVGRDPVALIERTSGLAERQAFLHRDYAGSTTAISTDDGIRRFTFDQAGRVHDPATTAPMAEVPPGSVAATISPASGGFGGHEHLASTGLIHMNGRVLDSTSARFLSADPYLQYPLDSQGLNRYAYTQNGFMAASDPSGYSLRKFLRRLGKKLFFNAPFILMGIPASDLFGISIGLSVGGFMPHGGHAAPPVPQSAGNGNASDVFSIRRETLVLSATDGARLANEAPRRLVAWRISQALSGKHIGAPSGTGGIDLDAIRQQAERIGERTTGLVGPELDSRERRRPGRVYITGHRIGGVGPIHTAIEFRDDKGVYWLSAGPEGYRLEGYRALVGGMGTVRNGRRQTDAPWQNAVLAEVRPPQGVSSQAYFGKLREAAEKFCNCIDYDLFPTLGGGYNSNGYVRGLINATGGQTRFDFTQLVGGGFPVPPEYFGY